MSYNTWKDYKFKFPFEGSENIKESFSQAWQDIFILTILKGQHSGTYLEIGCNVPQYTNNTFLLASKFNWNGISIDFLENLQEEWKNQRPNNYFYCGDATQIDYYFLLSTYYNSSVIDYLQLDIDPSPNTLAVLKKLPLDKFKFKIITFETDAYTGIEAEYVKEESRKILLDLGYDLLVKDVKVRWLDNLLPYEDWYVHSDFIDKDLSSSIKKESEKHNSIPEHFLFQ